MNSAVILMLLASGAAAVTVFSVMAASRHFFRHLLVSALSGAASLFAVNFLSLWLAMTIPINYITLSLSCFLGIPGVILSLLLPLNL